MRENNDYLIGCGLVGYLKLARLVFFSIIFKVSQSPGDAIDSTEIKPKDSGDDSRQKFIQVVLGKAAKEALRMKSQQRNNHFKQRTWHKKSLRQKILTRCLHSGLGSRVKCKCCKTWHYGQRAFYNHFLQSHRPGGAEAKDNSKDISSDQTKLKTEDNATRLSIDDTDDEDSKLVIDEGNSNDSTDISPVS